jgi:energy-coupling factor transport system ATP-binding protein
MVTEQVRQAAGTPAADAWPLLALDGVTYDYGAGAQSQHGRRALEGISLRLERGEYMAVLGHNGSGKSTLARLVAGLLLPVEGQVRIAGLDTRVPEARARIRELVGMIFSDPDNQIIATMVQDDVAWGLAARGMPRDEIEARVARALAAVGLTGARFRAPHELSGGQRQRLAIAGALALEPACLIADEPTALLDPRARVEVTELLRSLHRERGLSILHVTHLLEEAALAGRVVVLDRGRIVFEGSPRALLADLDRLRVLRLIVPPLAELGERLRQLGMPVPPDAVSPERLLDALAELETAR